MLEKLGSIGDRMLAAFLPEERAGACPCRPGEIWYDYRCRGLDYQRRQCVDKCDCNYTCGGWSNIGYCT